MKNWARKSYWALVKTEHFIGHILLLVIRIYWGILLVKAGAGKFTNIQEVSEFFEGFSIPMPLLSAILVGLFEVIGGCSLIVGFLTRFTTIPLVAILVTAYFTAHKESLETILTNPALFIMQPPLLYLYTTLVVLSFGAGMVSIDYWLERRSYQKELTF